MASKITALLKSEYTTLKAASQFICRFAHKGLQFRLFETMNEFGLYTLAESKTLFRREMSSENYIALRKGLALGLTYLESKSNQPASSVIIYQPK